MTLHEVVGLIDRWRDDAGGSYQSWFQWDPRLKNFRTIGRGLLAVVAEIETDTFGNAHRGSSLDDRAFDRRAITKLSRRRLRVPVEA